jgi:hypothetical protein
MATADKDTDTEKAKAPKRSGLGWIPKLSLWAVVIAFGYLYLSSIDRDSAEDAAQATAAQESGIADTSEEASGFRQFVRKVSELTDTAGSFVSDATTAGANGVKQVADKIKELTSSETTTVETAAIDAPTVAPVTTEAYAETGLALGDTAPAGDVEPEAPAAAARVTQPVSGFERHNAPLPAPAFGTATARGAGQKAEETAAATVDEVIADPVPVSQAEATAFAESLMREESPAAPAPAAEAPPVAQETAGTSEPAPLMPLAPQPVFRDDLMPDSGVPSPRLRAFDQQPEDMAQYRARMQAEHEAMRRAADQRAREYWERMQAPVPPGVAYPGYGPAYGGPAYGGPAYGQGYLPGPYGYPR